jgi:formate dehydrogenase (NADP+) alpha subunit
MTNSINEIPESKVMFVIGANPSEAHPVIGAKMRQALRKGAKLVVVDPRKTELAGKADVWLRLKPGTDIALINGLMHIILREKWHNQKFIDECTIDFAQVAATVEKYTPDYVSRISGVPETLLFEAAKLYATSERSSIFYTLGITEHVCGTDNVMSLANLAMMTGHIGKRNSGVNPLRGQNNVQGACDMGGLPNVLPGYQKVVDDNARTKFEQAWGVTLPSKAGLMIPEMFDAAIAGTVKAMYILGEDPVLTDADANHVKKALNHLDFVVVQNLFFTETAKLADVILPGASFAEKDGTFTNTERRIQRVRQAIPPIGNSRPDWQILIDLSNRMGYTMNYHHPQDIMAEMASLSPIYAGISYERIEERGLQWPVPHRDHPGTEYLHDQGKFSCGLGVFKPIEHQSPGEEPDADYPLLLTTGRILFHYNVTTPRYSKNLTSYRSQEYALINPEDAARLGINPNDDIEVSSRRGQVRCKADVTDKVAPGVVWMSFHYAASPTNEITSGAVDKVTKTYEYKVCAVKVQKTG